MLYGLTNENESFREMKILISKTDLKRFIMLNLYKNEHLKDLIQLKSNQLEALLNRFNSF